MNKFRNIAIIPARGGSKRLPGKNTADLGGKPLIVHSIQYALSNLEIIDRVVVSTDSPEIKKIAIEAGAEVIRRPSELSGDESPTWEAVRHAIKETGEDWNHIFVLQPTNPLRPDDLLKKAYKKFLEEGEKSLFSVSRIDLKLGQVIKGKYVPFNYKFGERSQDMEELYYENGLLYIAKSELVMKENCLISEENSVYEIDHAYAKVDVDSIEDFDYAKFIYKKYHEP